MKYLKYPQVHKNMTEEELSRRLVLSLMGIVGIILITLLSLFVFAPTIGSFFGLFSIHRNETDVQPNIKPASPYFINPPTSVKESTMSLSGTATQGTTVILYVNGPETAKTVVGSDGNFTFSEIKIIQGKNTIFAKAIDDKGQESDKTEYLYVTYDKEGPKIEELIPSDGDTIRNLDKRITISGKINEKAKIIINGKNAIQKSDNSFEFLLGVDEGSVKVTIEVTDDAGNKTTKVIAVKYEKKGA